MKNATATRALAPNANLEPLDLTRRVMAATRSAANALTQPSRNPPQPTEAVSAPNATSRFTVVMSAIVEAALCALKDISSKMASARNSAPVINTQSSALAD